MVSNNKLESGQTTRYEILCALDFDIEVIQAAE